MPTTPPRRPVFVGDVQGCADELEELLDRADAELGDAFELWVVGDVVNRGPDNLRALRHVRDRVDAGRGSCVLGNHELNLLRIAFGQRRASALDSIGDVLAAADADEWIEWVRRLPLVVTGAIGRQRFAMVHAAVHPEWDLAQLEQRARRVEARLAGPRADCEALLAGDPARDPDLDTLHRLTGCRSVGEGDRWSPEPPELAPEHFAAWHARWSANAHDYGIVYGHWAMQGLHVAEKLRGLDSGCVHHGRGRDGFLTAWVPDFRRAQPFGLPDRNFWQVRARRAYYAHRDRI